MEEVAKAGSCVLLDINNGEHFVFARLTPSATVKLGKGKYSLAPVVGCPFGSQFEPKFASLERSSRTEVANAGGGEEDEDENVAMKDNRGLVDDNTAQTLSAEEIHSMKREGTSGQEIVNALIANSASFGSKTAFSQEKYKRKKQKKYLPRLIMRCPTAKSVCEAYFAKTPAKIGFMRVDTLSMILSLANVGELSNVLVLDMVGGLLTAAVAERLSGFGTVCSVYYTPRAPSLDIVGLLNFDSSTSNRIFRFPLSTLLESRKPNSLKEEADEEKENFEAESEAMKTDSSMDVEANPEDMKTEQLIETENVLPEAAAAEIESTSISEASTEIQTTSISEASTEIQTTIISEASAEIQTTEASAATVENPEPAAAAQPKQRAIQQASNDDVSGWVQTGFSSLIIGALEVDPLKTLQQFLPFLSPSAPFVVYHTALQPLAECMFALQKDRSAVGLQLSEPWTREYQVLPSRTHPHMQMSSTGGYILTGIKVVSIKFEIN